MAAEPPAGEAQDVVGDVFGLGELLERRRGECCVDDVGVGQLLCDGRRPRPAGVDDVNSGPRRNQNNLVLEALLEAVETSL